MKKLTALLMSVALLISLLAGCGGGSSESAASDNADSAPAETENAEAAEGGSQEVAGEQVLNVLMGSSVYNLDCNDGQWTDEQVLVVELYEGLFRIITDDEGKDSIIEAGCESYDVSDDGLVYTFHLRENNWSDGEPVVASQYVDSFLRILDPENGLDTTEVLAIVNAEAIYNGEADASELGAVALDDLTLEITLEAYDSNFIFNMATRGYPIRQDVIDAATSEYGTDISEMVFNGPFVCTEWIKDNSLTLEKNANYWDAENISLDKVNMSCILETSTQSTMFNAQQLDIVEYNDDYADQWETQAANGEINYIDQVGAYSDFLAFPCWNGGLSGLMSNAKVRLALTLAVNREELVELVWGRYEPAYTYVPSVVTLGDNYTYNESGEGVIKDLIEEYNTDEALQALFQEGLTELGQSTDLSAVTLNLTVGSTLYEQSMAEALEQTWEGRLGINIETVVNATDSDYQETGSYDIAVNGWEGGNSPYSYLYVLNVPYGLKYLTGCYTNETVNEKLATVSSIVDVEEAAQVYHEIEDTLLNEAGVGPLFFTDIKYFTQSYVDGVYFTSFGPYMDFSHASVNG